MSAEITRINTAAESKLLDQFKSAHGSVPGDAEEKRALAIARFAKVGLPHRRIEAWHYTDLRSILRDAHAPAAMPDAALIDQVRTAVGKLDSDTARVVLVDGYYVAELSSSAPAAAVRSLLDVLGEGPSRDAERLAVPALEEQESVLALNAALMQGGAVLTVASGETAANPVEFVFVTSGAAPTAATTRSLVIVEAGATATIVERHIALGTAGSQGNHVLIVDVADGARLDHLSILPGTDPGAQQVATLIATIGADADFASFALVSGSGFVRRQSFVTFAGTASRGTLRGVSLLDGQGHADTTLVVTHRGTHCESRELFKHILDGDATGVFQGKVVVSPGAQKTDGKMMSRAVFLADGATMYNKPELEIFADDVVCGHGATAGFLDEEQLFYLRARGIPQKEAEALLLEAFAAEAIEDMGTEKLRAELMESVGQWLRQRQD